MNLNLSREDAIEAIQTINALAMIASIHGMFTKPVIGLMNTVAALKKQFNITEEECHAR